MKWRDVIKALVCCGAALFLVMAVIWGMETGMKISSLQDDVKRLKEAQRPLVHIEGGKYLTIFTKEKEVVIETAQKVTQ
ncbi:MAG TPA: hypothetical protein DDW42_01615 [Desulfobacteraceae bacterium]|nr:hypothetical protein [Desulfobacteraceae bacterium]